MRIVPAAEMVLEPDLLVRIRPLGRLLSSLHRSLIQIFYAAHEQLRPNVEAEGELADRGRVSPTLARLQLGDRVPRHPAPVRQLLLAHHSPQPEHPQTIRLHSPLPPKHCKKLAETLHQCYSLASIARRRERGGHKDE